MCLSFLHTWITLLFALLLLLLLQVCCIRMQATSIQIETKLGSIVGQQTRFEDVDLFTFYGIPYGESTGGSRRFLSSKLRNDLPSSPYFATNYTVHCPIGYVPRLDNAPMSEDCLHANIWMPKRSEFTLSDRNVLSTCGQVSLPVLVYLYGGEGSIFMLDHESSHLMYDGSAYAAFGDMIFVTINYRAGAFGQLAIPNQIPGNAGLFDQTVALQWIQKHIGHFCGDIRRVTLMGNSYGSMAAGLHLLSHKSAPYFSQVIMQSGSPLFSPYLPDFPDEAYEKSLALADKFGCTRSHLKQSKRIDLGCLQQIPMQSLVDELEWLQPFLMFGGDFFEANTIRQYEQKDQFEIAPDKRLVLGLVTNEVCISSVPLNTFIEKFNREPNLSKKQIERVMSKVVEFVLKLVDKQKLKPIAPSIASYYASESTYLNDSLSRTIDSFFGDFCFNCPSVLFGRAAVKALPAGHVHAFIVDQVPTRHLSSSLNNIPGDIVGVCHADELQFNFGNAFRYPNLFEEADRNYSKLLIQTLSRFVQQSDHLPKVTGQSAREVEWPASTKEHLHFVRIKLSGLELDRSRVEPRCESVWSRLRPVILKATFNETVQQLKEPQNWWVLAILIILTLIVIVWLFNCMTRCCRRSKYTYV